MTDHDPIRNPLGPDISEETRLRWRDDRRRTFELALDILDAAIDRRPTVEPGSLAGLMGLKGLGAETRLRLAADLAAWLMGEDNAFIHAPTHADELIDQELEDEPERDVLKYRTALRRLATEATNTINATHPAMGLDVVPLAAARNAAYTALDWPLHGRLPEDDPLSPSGAVQTVVRWLNEHGYRVVPNTWTAERVLPGDEELR